LSTAERTEKTLTVGGNQCYPGMGDIRLGYPAGSFGQGRYSRSIRNVCAA
jgi:hypothetical protein